MGGGPSAHDYYEGFHFRKWVLGALLPAVLFVAGMSGIALEVTYALSYNSRGFNEFEFMQLTGRAARLYGVGYCGLGLAAFGNWFAYNTMRWNPYYLWMLGAGCVVAIVFLPWGWIVEHNPGG